MESTYSVYTSNSAYEPCCIKASKSSSPLSKNFFTEAPIMFWHSFEYRLVWKKIVLRHFQVNYTWFFKNTCRGTEPSLVNPVRISSDPNLQTPALVKHVDILNCWLSPKQRNSKFLNMAGGIEYEGTEGSWKSHWRKGKWNNYEAPTCHPNIFFSTCFVPSILKCFIPFTFTATRWAKNNYPATHGGGRRGEIACQSYWGCGKDKIGTQFS